MPDRAWLARLLPPFVEVMLQVVAQDQNGAWGPDVGQAPAKPCVDGVLVNAKALGSLSDCVVAVDLDSAGIDSTFCHRSFRPRLDEAADVFDPPRRNASPELDGLRVTAILHTGPPRRFADGDWS
jgi:hypothetical protein